MKETFPSPEKQLDEIDAMISELTKKGFTVDIEEAKRLLNSGEAHSMGDAVCSSVPDQDWARARGTLGLIVDRSTGLQACQEAYDAMVQNNVDPTTVEEQKKELDSK